MYQVCFQQEDWSNTVYSDCCEDIPPNAPKCVGFGLNIRVYVDSNHAGNSTIRRSRTGFIVFLNNALIYWTSKKLGIIEDISFASELIAMKICCEYIRGIRYKFLMMYVSCDFPAYIYGDNQSEKVKLHCLPFFSQMCCQI